MSYSEEKFRDHIRTMVEKSQVDSDRPLTLDELKELALSMGLSDSEWDSMLEKAETSLSLAKKHLAVKNYLNAVESAEEATSINPYIRDGNAVLAQAYYQLSILEKNDEYLVKAGDYARRELVLDPMDATALHVLSAVENLNSEGRYSKKLFKYLGIGGAILLLLFFALTYCNNKASENDVRDILKNNTEENASSRANALKNRVAEKERIFKEAVQRRNEFLLSWFSSENTSNSNAGIEAIEDFDFNELNKSEMKIKKAVGAMKSEKALSMDDETRLEGMENRMAVEKKRWFESITEYNTQIQSYPAESKGFSQIDFPE
jgi:LemA protein